MRNHLLIVDGSNLFARAWWTMRNASLGDLPEKVRPMLTGVARRWEASHLVVALDAPDSFRHALIPGYKGERSGRGGPSTAEMTDALRPALDFWRVATREAPEMEADDVIATLAAKATQMDVAVSVLSKDTDLLQLVSDDAHVRVLWPEKGEELVMDEAAVREKTGIAPCQLLDFRTMVGVKDNLPRIGWTPEELDALAAERGKRVGAPWGFTEKRAVELLGAGWSLDADLMADPLLNPVEREWIQLRRAETHTRREALRLRDDLELVVNEGSTKVSALRLGEAFIPGQAAAGRPSCRRCGNALDAAALQFGGATCTDCGVHGRARRDERPSEVPCRRGCGRMASTRKGTYVGICTFCAERSRIEMGWKPVLTSAPQADLFAGLPPEDVAVQAEPGRVGNVTVRGPHRYYLAAVPGDPDRRVIVDRESGEVLQEGPWLNMRGQVLRMNDLLPEPILAGR